MALVFEPETKFQYSGKRFKYLRKAIESKLKKPFDGTASEILFSSLVINNTYFFWTPEINENDYAVEHDENGPPVAFEKYYAVNAAANLLTTFLYIPIHLDHLFR